MAYGSFCYISVSVAYVAGNLVSRTLVRWRPVNQLLWTGHGFFLAGALMMLGLGLSGAGRPWGLLVLLSMPVMTFGNGFLLPLSMSAGVTTFRATAGSASGLMGALQLLAAAVLGITAFALFLSLAGRQLSRRVNICAR
ncbi:MFS transporter [Streptomyces sp. SGAir0957]